MTARGRHSSARTSGPVRRGRTHAPTRRTLTRRMMTIALMDGSEYCPKMLRAHKAAEAAIHRSAEAGGPRSHPGRFSSQLSRIRASNMPAARKKKVESKEKRQKGFGVGSRCQANRKKTKLAKPSVPSKKAARPREPPEARASKKARSGSKT